MIVWKISRDPAHSMQFRAMAFKAITLGQQTGGRFSHRGCADSKLSRIAYRIFPRRRQFPNFAA